MTDFVVSLILIFSNVKALAKWRRKLLQVGNYLHLHVLATPFGQDVSVLRVRAANNSRSSDNG